jgi:hypothetical protein
MPQTPAPNAKYPRDLAQRRVPLTAPPPRLDAGLAAPTSALICDFAGLTRTAGARTRLCVLCGQPLRAGQHMLRVHGSTIHARCTNTGR